MGLLGKYQPPIGGRREREREWQRAWDNVPKHRHVDYLEWKGTVSIAPVDAESVEAVTSALRAAIADAAIKKPQAVEFAYWPDGWQPSLAIDLRGSCANGGQIRAVVGAITEAYSRLFPNK